jgi:hypothetical protein
MALSVDYLYKFVLNLIKKNQAGGLASKEFEYQWNDAQTAYQDDLLGRGQSRNNGKTGLNTGLIEDETILQKLSRFTKGVDLTIISGNADKPSDFVYRLAFRINGTDAYKITHGQIATVNESVIDPPSVANNQYYFVEYEDYYYILPHTLPTVSITTAQLDYIITPPAIVWGYTFDADDRQVYNSGTSVQSLWDNNSNREICKRVLANLGVSFKDPDFENFGKSVQLTGG